MTNTNEKGEGKSVAAGCGIGCLGVVAVGTLIGGLYYWFGSPFCFDAPCTDTGSVGPSVTFVGALLVTIVVLAIRKRLKNHSH